MCHFLFLPRLHGAAETSLEPSPGAASLLPAWTILNLRGSPAIFPDCLFEGRTISAVFILGRGGGREERGQVGRSPTQIAQNAASALEERLPASLEAPEPPPRLAVGCTPPSSPAGLLRDGNHTATPQPALLTAWSSPRTAGVMPVTERPRQCHEEGGASSSVKSCKTQGELLRGNRGHCYGSLDEQCAAGIKSEILT